MRDELKLSSHSATSDRETLHTQLLALTSDLKTTKLALDDIIKRERMVRLNCSFILYPQYLSFLW